MVKSSLFPIIAGAGILAASNVPTQKSTDDLLAEKFLAEADTILSIYPDDGNFGISRLPTMHGRQSFDNRKPLEKPCGDAWKDLESNNYLALITHGQFDVKGVPQRSSVMSGHYQLNWSLLTGMNDHDIVMAYHHAENRFHKEFTPKAATDLFLSGEKTGRTEFQYVKEKAVLYSRAIYPSSKACMGCHQDVPEGKPIGVISLIRLPKKS
jgi:hypothetical protein